MGFLNTNSMPRLVEKLADGDNIKITGNSKGNRVGTVIKKIVEKADEVTKAIEQEVVNDSCSFKVGTGDVDVSTDVQDGFGEVGVKGVAYQNLWNINKVNGATIEGNTVKVLANANDYKFCGIYLKDSCLKPNTTYTLVTNVFENTLDGRFNPCVSHSSSVFKKGAKEFQAKTTGVSMSVLTTKSAFTTENIGVRTFILNDCTEGFIKYNMLILEGDYSNASNLPSYFEGIVGVGDKSKNLFREYHDLIEVKSGQKLYLSSAETTNGERIGIKCFATDKVTMDLDIISPNSFYKQSNRWLLSNNQNKLSYAITVNKDGFIAFDDFLTTSQSYKRFNDIQLQEGSTATAYEPYYDGHKIKILSSNKNLLNWKEEEFIPVGGSSGYGIASKDHLGVCFDCNGLTDKGYGVQTNRQFTLKPNTKYTLGCEWDILRGTTSLTKPFSRVHFPNTNAYIGWRENGYVTFTTDYTGVVVFMFYIDTPSKSDIKVRFKNMFLYEGETNSYIENNQDKTQILLDEPLMRLPNGVCDEISRDRKLIRRVGKVVLDGSEDWKTTINLDGLTYRYSLDFKFKTSDNYNNVDNIICNDLATKNFSNIYNNGEKGITTWWSNDYIKKTIVICLSNNYSLEQFKEWLSQNPITVYYELETPIITELPAPYLRIFKDGHLTFNTLVAPESNHVVQLNKSAQIERSIREVQGLDSRVGQLESFYDDMILETSHKLNLLTYDFEYTKESEDI